MEQKAGAQSTQAHVQSLPVLLRTKLSIPFTQPGLVPRPRLIERLNAGLERKLTLVSAQAGFGKTTLLGEWISQLSAGSAHMANNLPVPSSLPPTPRIAWISLDEGDNDPVRFLAYLVGALQQVDESIGRSAQAFLSTPQLSPAPPASQANMGVLEAPVVALINDISEAAFASTKPECLVLVLDDYHLIHAASIHQAIGLLLERQPSHVHLVISTREEPPLSLPRLRVRNQMIEIREHDMRFTEAEATALFNNTLGLGLSPEAVSVLEARTEGWVAGLQLAALSLQDCDPVRMKTFIAAFAGDDRHVADYLVDQVLHRQPEEIQAFLHDTSILNRLSAPLCDAVLANVSFSTSSQAILEHLDAAHLFLIPLDNKRQWYRYHHLFADLLRYRLQRDHPECLAELHRRASAWYEQAGDVEEAIYHAFAIPDVPLAVHLAEQYGSQMINTGRIATILSWIEQMPADVVATHPYLCLGGAWAFALAGDEKTAMRYAQAGESALATFEPLYVAGEERVVSREDMRGDLATVRAFCARIRGDTAGVIEHSQQALEQLPAEDYATRCVVVLNLGLLWLENWEWTAAQRAFAEAFEMALKSEENLYVAVSALSMLGNVLDIQGELAEAVTCYQQAIELGKTAPAACAGHLGLAGVYYQRGEIPAALHHIDKALELAPRVGTVEVVISAYLLRARLALESGDLMQAQASLDQAGSLAPAHASPSSEMALAWGELYLAQGDVHALARHMAGRNLQPAELAAKGEQPRTLWERLPEYLLLARFTLIQGQADEALALLEHVVAAAKASRYAVVLIEATILQALAYHLKRNTRRALHDMECALALAEEQGYVSPFLRAGEALEKLLRQLIAQDVNTGYASKLLKVLRAPAPESLYESLTERESQVLRLLAAGLSSTEVAEELIIAVSTARSYIKTIYQKLDAHSRAEAIAKGQQLGLL
ncbi:MAG: hypothetical protein JW850_18950 [Thermoflexales bacterium]|nr:hypothetical protein [Thermoflexales bacterium]